MNEIEALVTFVHVATTIVLAALGLWAILVGVSLIAAVVMWREK